MDLLAALAASNQAGIDFLRTELGLANTFMDLAETTKIPEHRLKSHEDTQAAYRCLLKFLPRVQLSPQETIEFAEGMEGLRDRMLLAGVAL